MPAPATAPDRAEHYAAQCDEYRQRYAMLRGLLSPEQRAELAARFERIATPDDGEELTRRAARIASDLRS